MKYSSLKGLFFRIFVSSLESKVMNSYSGQPTNTNNATEALINQLNPPQQEACKHTEGPLMIIAGAGSGKTRVLTYRIAYLLAQGVDAFNILSLTFTNKAASEMRSRIEALVGPSARDLWMGTFHSVFAKILRIEAEKLGYSRNFTIYDTDDSKNLIKTILKEMNLDDKTYKPSSVYSRISMAKNYLVSPTEYALNPIYYEDDFLAGRPAIKDIYKKYAERCKKADAMDFDDLLFNTNILFRDHPETLVKYQLKFRYIMVDEYQDTNMSQYLITKKLAEMYRNIAVVGDDAQSIYAFRGADISNILNFQRDYPESKIVRLEQNYRSTKSIVEAANSVIAKNKNQLEKNVWTANEEGPLIEVIKAHTDTEEATFVATTIIEEKMKESFSNGDFAILYRTNQQSRSIEEALRRHSLKYKIIGGTSFYQRKEIKDLLAYLRFIVNPNDEESLKRIINYPKRSIGDATIQSLIVFAAEQGVPLWEVLEGANHIVSSRSAGAVLTFVNLIKALKVIATQLDAYEFAQEVAKQSGLLRELYEDKSPEGVSRYDNLQELLNGIKEFTVREDLEDKSLASFLQDVSLMTDADDKKKQDKDSITLMTIHGSKGLEFKSVFIVGLEEDLFPSGGQMGGRTDLEEERRLFYVAITRAEKKLHLSYALNRFRFGSQVSCRESRFLLEVDAKYLKMSHKFVIEDTPSSKRAAGMAGGTGGFMNQFKANTVPVKNPASSTFVHTPSANFVATDPKLLQAGMKVEHQKFGFGTITEIDHQNLGDIRATVQFQKAGEKKLVLTFAKLMEVKE